MCAGMFGYFLFLFLWLIRAPLSPLHYRSGAGNQSKLLFFLMRPSRGCVLPAQTPEFIPWHCIYLAESLFFHALRLLCSRGVSAARIRGALDLQLVTHSPRKGAKLAWSHILAL